MKTMTKRTVGLVVALVLGAGLGAVAAPNVVRISEYPNATGLADGDLFVVAVEVGGTGATNKNVRWDQLAAMATARAAGGLMANADGKGTNTTFYGTSYFAGSNFFAGDVTFSGGARVQAQVFSGNLDGTAILADRPQLVGNPISCVLGIDSWGQFATNGLVRVAVATNDATGEVIDTKYVKKADMVTSNYVSAGEVALQIAASNTAWQAASQIFTGQNTFTQPINVTGTNSVAQNINFNSLSYVEGDFATNATFAWLGFSGTLPGSYQTAVVWLTNSSGSLITFTVPSGTHTLGTLNCTNVTELVFRCHANRWTNLLSLPLW